jgi:hypothetical protein
MSNLDVHAGVGEHALAERVVQLRRDGDGDYLWLDRPHHGVEVGEARGGWHTELIAERIKELGAEVAQPDKLAPGVGGVATRGRRATAAAAQHRDAVGRRG